MMLMGIGIHQRLKLDTLWTLSTRASMTRAIDWKCLFAWQGTMILPLWSVTSSALVDSDVIVLKSFQSVEVFNSCWADDGG